VVVGGTGSGCVGEKRIPSAKVTTRGNKGSPLKSCSAPLGFLCCSNKLAVDIADGVHLLVVSMQGFDVGQKQRRVCSLFQVCKCVDLCNALVKPPCLFSISSTVTLFLMLMLYKSDCYISFSKGVETRQYDARPCNHLWHPLPRGLY